MTGKQIYDELIKAAEVPEQMNETLDRIVDSEGYSHSWRVLRDEKARLIEANETVERRMYKEMDGDMKFSAKEIDNRIRLLKRELHEILEGKRVLDAHNIVCTAARHTLQYASIEKSQALHDLQNKKFVYLYTKEEK